MDVSLLGRELFAGITVAHALGGALALFVIATVVRALTRGRPTGGNHLVKRRCGACRWTGEVSQYNKVCPRCAAKLT